MDAVITYVNGLDPVWRDEYSKALNVPALDKRFRDWGTLKYLLRGIETHMPFVRNIHLVVSGPTQVPGWASGRLNVVTHSDIIPQEFLPTFNSTTIEMFLHRIPGLDERFIYFNDDMFPVAPCKEEDFFRDGKIVIGFSHHIFAGGMYKRQSRNSDRMARMALGRGSGLFFVRPQHICSPMLRSASEEVFEKMRDEIYSTLSQVRTRDNLNQYLFLDYLYHQGRAIRERLSGKFFSIATSSASRIGEYLKSPSRKLVCINDVHLKEESYQSERRILLDSFERALPLKSAFEK
ncbi:MAG TPA: hypothetical protein DDX40_06995 [Rikenellaceae bacterium]|nr:hypothetical protein [Rikenellaceae bacterium]